MTPTLRFLPSTLLLCSAALAAPRPEQAELAERFLQMGQRLVGTPATARVAAALADIAEPMFENDARLYRTAIDLRLSLGQRDQALALLNAYRRLDPNDQLAQVQSIDLNQSKMESATERADYLSRVAGSDRVPAEVRSHAAALLAGVQIERGDDAATAAAVEQSLALNALNPKALQMKADRVARDGTAPQRTAALVNLLLADPMQYPTASRLAEELLRAGLTEPARAFYPKFFSALETAGYAPGPDDLINYSVLLALGGDPRGAGEIAAEALRDYPADPRVQFLKLQLAKSAGDDAGVKSGLDAARDAIVGKLETLHAALTKSTAEATSRPALPDLKADVQLLQTAGVVPTTNAYLAALADLAWLDIEYAGHAPDAAVTEAVTALAGADSPLVHRLAGFASIATGKKEEAEVALSAVASRDPLSQLGLLQLQLTKGQDKAAIVVEAGKLLQQMPTDIWPLVIHQQLKDAGPIAFRTADADAVAAEAAKLPSTWLAFAGDARSRYYLMVEPMQGTVAVGEPIVVRVTLQNLSDHRLAIGPGGAIAEQVALDATVRAATEQSFAAAAVAKLGGRLVLGPRESTSAVVRLDSAELGNAIGQTPQTAASVFVSGVTNPMMRQNVVAPGPGGLRAQGRGVVDRPQIAFTRPEVRDQLAKQLQDADPIKRRRAASALGACAAWLAGGNDEQKALAPQAIALLKQAAEKDASATVRATAWQELATTPGGVPPAEAARAMLATPDAETRVIACILLLGRPQAERLDLLRPLTGDADPQMATLAAAVTQLPDAAPPAKP